MSSRRMTVNALTSYRKKLRPNRPPIGGRLVRDQSDVLEDRLRVL
jgi:hypothetical protein